MEVENLANNVPKHPEHVQGDKGLYSIYKRKTPIAEIDVYDLMITLFVEKISRHGCQEYYQIILFWLRLLLFVTIL